MRVNWLPHLRPSAKAPEHPHGTPTTPAVCPLHTRTKLRLSMAAFNTIDAVRAAEFWLYFPNQRLQQGLQPYKVPEMYFFYPSPQEANYFVNIDAVADAAAKQV